MISEIDSSAATPLQAVKLLALYLSSPNNKVSFFASCISSPKNNVNWLLISASLRTKCLILFLRLQSMCHCVCNFTGIFQLVGSCLSFMREKILFLVVDLHFSHLK